MKTVCDNGIQFVSVLCPGLTGGLAAPLIAAGAGVIIGSAGAAALGSTTGVIIIGSLFGVGGAGLTGLPLSFGLLNVVIYIYI